jgi:hypothetical protein
LTPGDADTYDSFRPFAEADKEQRNERAALAGKSTRKVFPAAFVLVTTLAKRAAESLDERNVQRRP